MASFFYCSANEALGLLFTWDRETLRLLADLSLDACSYSDFDWMKASFRDLAPGMVLLVGL